MMLQAGMQAVSQKALRLSSADWFAYFRYGLQQFNRGLADRAHQRQLGELEQIHQDAQALFDQLFGARLRGRPVVDPIQDQAHLIQPQEFWKVRPQIVRRVEVATLDRLGKMLYVLLANVVRLLAEG